MKIPSYTAQSAKGKSIAKLAEHYEDIDMAERMGADQNKFPFVIKENGVEKVYYWYSPEGRIKQHIEDDPVAEYATLQYLKDNAYPSFESLEAAERHAKEREWPTSKV